MENSCRPLGVITLLLYVPNSLDVEAVPSYASVDEREHAKPEPM